MSSYRTRFSFHPLILISIPVYIISNALFSSQFRYAKISNYRCIVVSSAFFLPSPDNSIYHVECTICLPISIYQNIDLLSICRHIKRVCLPSPDTHSDTRYIVSSTCLTPSAGMPNAVLFMLILNDKFLRNISNIDRYRYRTQPDMRPMHKQRGRL